MTRLSLLPVLLGLFSTGCSGGPGGSHAARFSQDFVGGTDVTIADAVQADAGCSSGKACDDQIACTSDLCIGGLCLSVPDDSLCGKDETCNPAKGGCFKAKSCFRDADCDDFIDCTVEACNQENKLCETIYDDARCPLNAVCVPFSWLTAVGAAAGLAPPGRQNSYAGCLVTSRCKADKDCTLEADLGKCSAEACVTGLCAVLPADSGACSDGDPCNGEEVCKLPDGAGADGFLACYKAGANEDGTCDAAEWSLPECQAGTPVDCDDGEVCTLDQCLHADGSCAHVPVSDGTPCEGGVCTDGVCGCENPDCHGLCCEAGEVCLLTGCCKPDCTDKTCGDNGCGGSCGSCDGEGEVCRSGLCKVPNNDTCPTAAIASDQGHQVIPQTRLKLRGDGSSAKDGTIAAWQWEVKQPWGSVSRFFPASSATDPEFEVNMAGVYTFYLTVWDDRNVASCVRAEYQVAVVPDKTIHVELFWRTPEDEDESDVGSDVGSDLDLHFVHPFATGPDIDNDGKGDGWFSQPFDCFWFNQKPNWGSFSSSVDDDPSLDREDTDGAGPENLNLNGPEDNTVYTIGVHYWNDHDFGEAFASLRIYIDGKQVYEITEIQLNELDLWEACTLAWPSKKITPVVNANGQYKITPNYKSPYFNPDM